MEYNEIVDTCIRCSGQTRVISISITSSISFLMRAFELLSSSYFETYSTFLLTVVT
jgi:hypothetical protein